MSFFYKKKAEKVSLAQFLETLRFLILFLSHFFCYPCSRKTQMALFHPCKTIMKNAGLEYKNIDKKDWGVDVETGKTVNMFKAGIIDPVLVTKSALKNAASVASTILSTNCVMSNLRE